MTALKNHRLIAKLSLRQKLQLVCSGDFYNTSAVEGIELPTLKIKSDPYDEGCENLRLTRFPNPIALAGSWNPALVEEVYRAIGEEARTQNGFAYFNSTDDLLASGVTSEYFLLSEFASAKIRGLSGAKQTVNFQDVYTDDSWEADERRLMRDAVFGSSRPDSVIVSDMNVADSLRERYKYDGLIYCPVATVEEALDALYGGSSLLFLERDIFDDLYSVLSQLTEAYTVAHTRFMNDTISESAFARLLRNFKIFDPNLIDRACDGILSVMFSMLAARKNAKNKFPSLIEGEKSVFDEKSHHELAVEAARQSAVLVKNEGGVLPLSTTAPVAVIGEYAEDISCQDRYYSYGATAQATPYDLIPNHGVNAVGYARGYASDEVGRRDLIDTALSLCARAHYALVYLSAPEGAPELPAGQIELLKAISGRGAKIIAVVSSSFNIDLGFTKLCDAVLLTYVSGQGGAQAALEIITGAVTPSGRLTEAVGMMEDGEFKRVHGAGYGLSYTQFTYQNLQLNGRCATFTVVNAGDYDGYAVPRLFVKKEGSDGAFAENVLCGFTKVFVKKGDAVSVEIPFDNLTFSVYDEEAGYFVEGGDYTISVYDGTDDLKLSGTLTLDGAAEVRNFDSKVIASSDEGDEVKFSYKELPKDRLGKGRAMPASLKIFIAVMLAVYVDVVLCVFLFTKIIATKTMVLYIVSAGIAVLVNGVAALFVAHFIAHREKSEGVRSGMLVADMLDDVEEFTEIAKVRYGEPVPPAEKEYEEAEEEDGEEVPDEENSEDYTEAEEAEEEEAPAEEQYADESEEAAEEQYDDEEEAPESAENLTPDALCANLKEFFASRGIVLELSSARSLIAAMAASKIVFLTSRNLTLLPEFEQVLDEYFSMSAGIVTASDDWRSQFDLLWRVDGEELNLSDFTAAVYSAASDGERQTVAIIDDVNIANLGSYFSTFISYANLPAERWEAKLGEDVSLILPDNLTYVLVPREGSIASIPSEILSGATVVDVIITADESQTESAAWVEPFVVTKSALKNMTEEAKTRSYLSEEVWKKIDALADEIAETESFNIGNKNVLQMERYSSVLLDAGADEYEALTAVFLGKLNYVLKNTKIYKSEGGDRKVCAIIEKIFADEELTKVPPALIKAVEE